MIEIKNVSKSFSKRKAVDQVSFTIREGEVFGASFILSPSFLCKYLTVLFIYAC